MGSGKVTLKLCDGEGTSAATKLHSKKHTNSEYEREIIICIRREKENNTRFLFKNKVRFQLYTDQKGSCTPA